MINERNNIFDIAKGIGIILVVYGHVARGLLLANLAPDTSSLKLVDEIIYSFHMPLFFFLSGIFFLKTLEKNGIKKTIAAKADSIAYPYIIWSTIQGIIEVVFSKETNNKANLSDVLNLAWKPRAQFWFLYILFFTFIIAAIVYKRTSKKHSVLVFISSLLIYLTLSKSTTNYLISTIIDFFPYFSLGILFSFCEIQRDHINKLVITSLCVTFLISQKSFCYLETICVHINANILSFAAASSGIMLTMSISKTITFRHLSFLGKNSLYIYLGHILTGSGTRIILTKLLGITDIGINLAIGTIAGIYGSIILAKFSEKVGFGFIFLIPEKFSILKIYSQYIQKSKTEQK